MLLRRRDFSAALLGASAVSSPLLASAQGAAPVEGRNYQRMGQPLPTPPGKIEVIEFFWYGCPHCFVFDPTLEAWVKQLPADVSFRRLHVGFNAMVKLHQKLFFALEAMGVEAQVHAGIFNAFHVQRLNLTDEASITAMVTKLGVDPAKFKAAFNSFGVQTKAQAATKLSEDYRIDGVPTLAIGGRFTTSPSMAGAGVSGLTEESLGKNAIGVADYLLKLARTKA
ncbi:thiol:disulfide interchange protein DsbA/DsbL [Paucibacter sp. R3-3]|uniref:Thiol:disulfide interchange protein DsbA n=1 Tax=Roseateles agri TaxID=3098619 RepID=A0ABU5DTP0_9BURK|nr:thiol:disulfide interchange protein DsbA/DsbL [Paucibacter sp. R3-3]MDY0748859.1 thiol:disulfide interchange protein DsbA/DsbL [Paucibacter sp. R3-3]